MSGPALQRIDDPADPRIAAYRDIRDRELAARRGLFVAEGEVVLRRLLSGRRFRPASVLVESRRVASFSEALMNLPEDAAAFHAPQAVLNAIAGFDIHRGVLGLGWRRIEPGLEPLLADLPGRAVVPVLYGVGNPDNMGAIFRNAAAFGCAGVVLDAHCCDPLYRKALRVSVGAALMVPFARLAPGEDPLPVLEAHGFEPAALSPTGALPLARLQRGERMAPLFGPEGPGLAPELLARVRTVRIPMAPGLDSLNVATASGLVLHHLAGLED